jgi:hypothetical protein
MVICKLLFVSLFATLQSPEGVVKLETPVESGKLHDFLARTDVQLLELRGEKIDDSFVKEIHGVVFEDHSISQTKARLEIGECLPELMTVVVNSTSITPDGVCRLINCFPGVDVVLSEELAISLLNSKYEIIQVFSKLVPNRVGPILGRAHLEKARDCVLKNPEDPDKPLGVPLGQLRHLRSVDYLEVHGSPYDDEILSYFEQCTLRHVTLRDTRATGTGLVSYKDDLESLFVFDGNSTFDFGLLSQFKNLNSLIARGNCTNKDFLGIAGLPNLRKLHLLNSQLNGDVLEESKAFLKKLEYFAISRNGISDDFATELRSHGVRVDIIDN